MHFLFFFPFSVINIKYNNSSPWSCSAVTGQPSSPSAWGVHVLLCAHVTSGALGDSHAASESVNAGSKVTSPAHAHTGALAAHLQRPPQVSLILSKMTFLARFPGLCAVLAACRAAPITATCICLHWSFLSGLSRHKAALKGKSWLLPTPALWEKQCWRVASDQNWFLLQAGFH